MLCVENPDSKAVPDWKKRRMTLEELLVRLLARNTLMEYTVTQ
jgi:hypothetical protein